MKSCARHACASVSGAVLLDRRLLAVVFQHVLLAFHFARPQSFPQRLAQGVPRRFPPRFAQELAAPLFEQFLVSLS